MAYFSNGSEGEFYRERYCERCVHGENEPCPIITLHLLWNYEQHDNGDKKTALNILWPRGEGGIHNGDCAMFIAKKSQ